MSCFPWAIPCQWNKCCRCYSCYSIHRPDVSASDIHFKLYANDPAAIDRMVFVYNQLTDGLYFKPRRRSCLQCIIHILRPLIFVLLLILFSPLVLLALILALIKTAMKQTARIAYGLCLMNCKCTRKMDEYLYPESNTIIDKFDRHSFFSTDASTQETRRFHLYIMPIAMISVIGCIYWNWCRYLAGLHEAKLVEDDVIIYWLHLWGTVKSHFVYQYDADSLVCKFWLLSDHRFTVHFTYCHGH